MQKKRNGALDFWKLAFCIIIVIFHGHNAESHETTLFAGANFCVDYFFLVSGLLMASTAERKPDMPSLGRDTLQFMKHKIGRLMPNYYVAWIIGFLVEHYGRYSIQGMLDDAAGAVWELLLVTESGLLAYRVNPVCWYMSGMLIAMLILYPLMRKYKDTYFYVLAPIAIILIMGITYQNWKNLQKHQSWFGFAYKGTIRALLVIMMGSVSYKMAMALRSVSYTKLAKFLFTLVKWGLLGYLVAWCYMQDGTDENKTGWLILVALTIAVTIMYAQVDLLGGLFSGPLFGWMGELSFSLYLGHGYWSHFLIRMFPDWSYEKRLPQYLVLSAVTGLFIMYFSKALKKCWAKHGAKIKSKFIMPQISM